MLKKDNYIVLVQTNLLLRENEFEALRDCISKLDLTQLQLYDQFNYDFEEDKVLPHHQPLCPDITNINWLGSKFKEGYIALNLTSLKKLLSL